MKKLSLNIDDLRVASFETEREDEDRAAAIITGTVCITRYPTHNVCCAL